jgi:hypothetical protein
MSSCELLDVVAIFRLSSYMLWLVVILLTFFDQGLNMVLISTQIVSHDRRLSIVPVFPSMHWRFSVLRGLRRVARETTFCKLGNDCNELMKLELPRG